VVTQVKKPKPRAAGYSANEMRRARATIEEQAERIRELEEEPTQARAERDSHMEAHMTKTTGHPAPPATLSGAIDAVLALIDDPASWPATVKAERACSQLRKALISAIDVLKADSAIGT
jgi:hypothetical protein